MDFRSAFHELFGFNALCIPANPTPTKYVARHLEYYIPSLPSFLWTLLFHIANAIFSVISPPTLSHAVDMKKRLQPVGAEAKPRYSDSSSASTHHHYNGLATKRSSFTSDGLPIVRGSHGTVTLGSRRSSTDAVTMAARDPCLPDGIGNGHVASSKYALPPLV